MSFAPFNIGALFGQTSGSPSPWATPGIIPQAQRPSAPSMGGLAEILKLQQEAQGQYEQAARLRSIGGANSRGWGDVIATLIGGYRASKMRGEADENIAQAIQKQLAYEQEQKRLQAETEARQRQAEDERAITMHRRKAEVDAQYRQPRALSDFERFQQDPEGYARYKAAGRASQEPLPPDAVRKYEYLMSLPEEQRPMAARALGIETGAKQETPSKGYRVAEDGESWEPIPGGPADKPEAGPKPLPSEAVRRLGLLDSASAKLDKFLEYAFDGDGSAGTPDYKEVAGRFGTAREDYLKQAIQDLLYVKTGAAAPESEAQRMFDTLSPSVFSTDQTNWNRAQMLKEDIETQRRAILEGRGSVSEEGVTSQRRSPDEIMATLRAANPGVSDEELAAYAQEQGYF